MDALNALRAVVQVANRLGRIAYFHGPSFYFRHMMRPLHEWLCANHGLDRDIKVLIKEEPAKTKVSDTAVSHDVVVYVARLVPLCVESQFRVALCTEHDEYDDEFAINKPDVAIHFSGLPCRSHCSTPFLWHPFTYVTDIAIVQPSSKSALRKQMVSRIVNPYGTATNVLQYLPPLSRLSFVRRATNKALVITPINTPRRYAFAALIRHAARNTIVWTTPSRLDVAHSYFAASAALLLNTHAWWALDYSAHCCHCGTLRMLKTQHETTSRNVYHRWSCDKCKGVDTIADFGRLSDAQKHKLVRTSTPSPRYLEIARLADFAPFKTPFLTETPADAEFLLRALRRRHCQEEAKALQSCFCELMDMPGKVVALLTDVRAWRNHALQSAIAYRGLQQLYSCATLGDVS